MYTQICTYTYIYMYIIHVDGGFQINRFWGVPTIMIVVCCNLVILGPQFLETYKYFPISC